MEVCEEVFCDDCAMGRACHHCNQMRCRTCIMSYKCSVDGCNKAICAECVRSEGDGGRCHVCGKSFCSKECQYLNWSKDEMKACYICSAAASAFQRNL